MSDPILAIQKAIYEALDAALDPVPVYDKVPQNSTYPYIVLNNMEVANADYLNARKSEVFMYISVWSQYRGQKEVIELSQTIEATLHRNLFTLDTGRMVQCHVQNRNTMREPDNLTFQGMIKLRIICEN